MENVVFMEQKRISKVYYNWHQVGGGEDDSYVYEVGSKGVSEITRINENFVRVRFEDGKQIDIGNINQIHYENGTDIDNSGSFTDKIVGGNSRAVSNKLNVLSYADGFTLWSYQSNESVTTPGFFNTLADMLLPGDAIMASLNLASGRYTKLYTVKHSADGVVVIG
jgi:hypothetical protein